jgi:hypothetical protein
VSGTYVPLWLVTMVMAVFMVVLILMAQQHAHLVNEIRGACAETGAAAKLDLSSFVPLCLEVKR